MPRRPPLHTIGASILAIIHSSFIRANNVNGPIGSLTKRATRLMNSSLLQLICTILCQWLPLLFMADNYILAFEDAVEKIFPPSNRLFDRIDRLVYDAECLPSKFDDALDTLTLSKIVRIFSPFLANCLIISAWLLSCLIYALTLLGILKSNKKEKDSNINIIVVDDHHVETSLICKNNIPSRNSGRVEISREKANPVFDIHDDHFPCVESTTFTYHHQGLTLEETHKEPPHDRGLLQRDSTCVPYYNQSVVARCDKLEHCVELDHPNNISPTVMKCSDKEILEKKDCAELNHPNSIISSNGMKFSYKEILEKGSNQEEEEEDDMGSSAGSTISNEEKMEGGKEKDEEKKSNYSSATPFSFNLNDPILELYEASWQLK